MRTPGNWATIGRKSAVIELPFLRLKGLLAWWMWGAAHIYFLIGLPSPLLVSFRWLWQYVTYGRGARLITGESLDGECGHLIANFATAPLSNRQDLGGYSSYAR